MRGLALAGVLALDAQLLVLLRFVAVPPEIPPVPEAGPLTGDDRRVGENRLVRADGIWTMHLSGTPAEMGAAHGLLTRDLRDRLEAETFAAFRRAVPHRLGRAAILQGVFVLAPGLDAHIDDRWRIELASLVASTPDPRSGSLPAYTRKLYFHALFDIGQALVDSPLVACTGFLATGAATRDGHTLLARNFDFEGGRTFDEEKIVIVRRPDVGLATVSVAFPGMVGIVSGINERRIAVALQAAGSDAPIRMAEPMTLALREALEEATSLDDVARVLDRRRGFATELVLAVDGVRGETAVFEVTPDRVERLPPTDLVGVANQLRSPVFARDRENARRTRDQTTAVRLARMEELIEARRGSLDLPTAAAVLRDRAAPGGVPLPRGHRQALDADIASHAVAIDATDGVLWVSVTPNLSGGFVGWQIDALIGGDLDPEPVVGPTSPEEARVTHRMRELVRDAEDAGPAEAERLLREALAARPDHPEVLLALAERVAARGDRAELRSLLDRAEVARPETRVDRERLDALRAVSEETGPGL